MFSSRAWWISVPAFIAGVISGGLRLSNTDFISQYCELNFVTLILPLDPRKIRISCAGAHSMDRLIGFLGNQTKHSAGA